MLISSTKGFPTWLQVHVFVSTPSVSKYKQFWLFLKHETGFNLATTIQTQDFHQYETGFNFSFGFCKPNNLLKNTKHYSGSKFMPFHQNITTCFIYKDNTSFIQICLINSLNQDIKNEEHCMNHLSPKGLTQYFYVDNKLKQHTKHATKENYDAHDMIMNLI